MSGQRDPWGRLARMTFGAEPYDAAEAERLRQQIEAGYKKTGKRRRARTTRDGERNALLARAAQDEHFRTNLTGGSLGKVFLNECIDVFSAASLTPPPDGWSHNGVRLLIKELRTPKQPARPYYDPNPPDDSDWQEWPDM